MKKIIQQIITLIFVTILFSCNNKEIEVVSQDTAYQLNADYVFVDIPQKFGFDPSNIVYLSGQTNLTLNGQNDGQNTTIVEGNSVVFKIKIKKTVDKDVAVKLVADDNLLAEYIGDKINIKNFPPDTYSISEGIFPAGETEANVTFTFKNVDKFNDISGYLLPLRLEMVSVVDGLKISKIKYSVFITLNMKIVRDNIDPTNPPITGNLIDRKGWSITALSSFSNNLRPQNMLDGDISTAWFASLAQAVTTLNMGVEKSIQGIKLTPNVTYGMTYNATKIKVYSGNNGQNWLGEGTYTGAVPSSQEDIINIKFKKNITAQYIKLEVIESNKTAYTGFSELNVVAGNE